MFFSTCFPVLYICPVFFGHLVLPVYIIWVVGFKDGLALFVSLWCYILGYIFIWVFWTRYTGLYCVFWVLVFSLLYFSVLSCIPPQSFFPSTLPASSSLVWPCCVFFLTHLPLISPVNPSLLPVFPLAYQLLACSLVHSPVLHSLISSLCILVGFLFSLCWIICFVEFALFS